MKKPPLELSLRPYTGVLLVARSRKEYDRLVKSILGARDDIPPGTCGRFATEWIDSYQSKVYIIWASKTRSLIHEMCHVILDVFKNVGIDPRDANGEPFCYLMSQLILDYETSGNQPHDK